MVEARDGVKLCMRGCKGPFSVKAGSAGILSGPDAVGKGGDLPLLQVSCCGIPSGSLRKSMRSQAACRARIKILLKAGRDCVTPFSILVSNSVTNAPNKTYSTFTYTEDPNYGPYLQSVNGLKGNTKDRTYWELLVEKANETVSLNVGIGCYIPIKNDQIILNFKEY
ncbi:hypothetical protein F7725_020254 [Dissostichus mawsoni]|uniref:Transcobalamin-like C-terminal domain-containing protein n=1 Tax=Dissostichus mawsoni TaxID=36200 RepID=A0A7J5YCN7_DISMA|nr:hypothetical protein F7725_020254 [Dissostichus mawsoni]